MTSVDLKNLSIKDLKKIKHNKVKNLRKKFNEYEENQDKKSLINEIQEIEKQKDKIKKGKLKPIIKTKQKHKTKTFNDYFLECIKNKMCPKQPPAHKEKPLVPRIDFLAQKRDF